MLFCGQRGNRSMNCKYSSSHQYSNLHKIKTETVFKSVVNFTSFALNRAGNVGTIICF